MGDSLRQALIETLRAHRPRDRVWRDAEGPAAKWRCSCGMERPERLALVEPAWFDQASVVLDEAREHVAEQLEYAVAEWLKQRAEPFLDGVLSWKKGEVLAGLAADLLAEVKEVSDVAA